MITDRRRRLTIMTGAVMITALVLAGCGTGVTQGPLHAPPVQPDRRVQPTQTDVTAWLDGIVPALIEREGLAGATVSVVGDGRVLTVQGYGAAELGNAESGPRPVDPQRTLFRIGSVSKLVTTTAVLQQVEAGRLDLDADVQTYLDFDLDRAFAAPVTLRHLLSHTAGYEDKIRGLIMPAGTPAPDLRAEVAVDQPQQLYPPGTTPAYSNWSNALAAYVVQRVSGTPFADYARTEIFERAGMPTATLAQPLPESQARQLASGYANLSAAPTGFEVIGPAPAGSVSASGTDLAAFMLGLLGTPAEGAQPVLTAESLRLMAEPALGPETLGGLAGADQMGIGVFRYVHPGGTLLGHGGDTGVFHSQLLLVPSAGLGIFVSTNTSGKSGDSTAALRTAVVDGFVDRYLPVMGADESPSTDTSVAHAAQAAGAYQLSRRSESTFLRSASAAAPLTVTDHGDGTITVPGVATTGGLSLRLREIRSSDQQWLWQEVGGDRLIAMDIRDGRVRAIGMDPAHTLLPMAVDRQLATPLSYFSSGWAALVLIAWPIGAIVRRRHGVDLTSWSAGRRVLRTLTHLGLLSVGLSTVAWLGVLSLISAGPVPDLLIRITQALTILPALAVIPAVLQVVATARERGGVLAVIANTITALSLIGYAAAAVITGLLNWDLTY